jgi:transcriptional regulator with XRE-family HTH domain
MLRRLPTTTTIDLAGLRSHLGITQAQLADELGVEQQQVWKWERATDMRTSRLRRVIEALGRISAEPVGFALLASVGTRTFEVRLPDPSPPAVLPHDRRAFRVRAWSDHRIEAAFISQGFVAIGDDANEVRGPYPLNPSDEVIRAQLGRDWPDKGPQTIGIWTSYWRTFLNTMQTGDIVVFAPKAPWVAIGEISGPYEYAGDEREGRLRHRRPVRWLNPDLTRTAVDDDLLGVINAPGTICEIGRPDAATRLIETATR